MKLKKKWKIIIAIVLAVVALATAVFVIVMQNKNQNVISYTVSTNSLNNAINGAGYLSYYEEENITLYSALPISSYLVSVGSEVNKGDGLMTVSASALASAIASCENAISSFNSKIVSAETTTSTDTVVAPISGRIKEIYATVNEDVQTTIKENGKLMTISIDGYMAFDIELENADLKNGSEVNVVLSSGAVVKGTVKTITGDTYKIVISDEYGSVGETVYIYGYLGTSILYINSPVEILASSGMVEEIEVSMNSIVISGRTLLVLNGVTVNSEYDELVEARRVLTEQLAVLISASQNNIILSTKSGVISSLTSSSSPQTAVASIANSDYMLIEVPVNELDILNVYEGMKVAVTIDAINSDNQYVGFVSEVGTTASTSSSSTSYTVSVLIPKTSDMISGMSCSVELILSETLSVIMVPIAGLAEDENGVYVYTNSKLSKKQYITLGGVSSVYVEVTEGLEIGDEIYYEQVAAEENFPSLIPSISTDIVSPELTKPGFSGDSSGMTRPEMGGRG